MTTVKFDRSVKYQGVRYDAHTAFEVDDVDVEELKKAGATVLSVEPNTPPQPELDGAGEDGVEDSTEGAEDVDALKESLLEYTVSALTRFAEHRGIDLQGKTRKADIYNIIVAALN